MPEPDFHPDDPTTHIWLKLLKTEFPSRGAMSAEERRKKSLANKAYYEEHPAPAPFPGALSMPKESVVYGQCSECGNDIYDERMAKIGMGYDCLRNAVETGRVVVENGEYVLRKKRKRKRG